MSSAAHLREALPVDERPSRAIELAHAWAQGEIQMTQARTAAGHAMGAARDLSGAEREAIYVAGHAAMVAHVTAHEFGAAAYAIRAVRAAALESKGDEVGRLEFQWQRGQLPNQIRELVLDDQRLSNEYCWFLFRPSTPLFVDDHNTMLNTLLYRIVLRSRRSLVSC